MRVVFWQNEMSFHQASFVGAVSRAGVDVVWVVERKISDHRRAMGWPVPDPLGVRVVVSPCESLIGELVSERLNESIHVFSGIRAYRTMWLALQRMPAQPGLRFLLAEPGGTHLAWRLPRLLRAIWDRRQTGRKLDAVLAIGDYGVTWYRRAGYRDRVFPFAYFMDEAFERSACGEDVHPRNRFRIIYVGRLLETKGVADLLRAVAGLTCEPWDLRIVGDGPEGGRCRAEASRLGLDASGRVKFLGGLSNVDAMSELSKADLLVQPSRGIEGWGVIVNEALLRGIPVLCTDRVGANVLVGASRAGSVVPARNVTTLRDALSHWIRRGPLSTSERDNVRDWSTRITGDAAARYFLKIVDFCQRGGDRPEPPWSEHVQGSSTVIG